MKSQTPEDFRRIKQVYLKACQLSGQALETYLVRTCDGDEKLRGMLDTLLTSIESLELPSEDFGQLEDTLTYEGTAYRAADHGRAIFCRDHNELQPEEYEYWEFEGDGEQYITLVRWSDGSTEASYSVEIRPSFITVYSRS